MKIHKTETEICVESDYNWLFIKAARALNGSFSNKKWCFNIVDEERVRAACFKYYGDDGIQRDTVTLRAEWQESGSRQCGAIEVFGRQVASATGRDSGARTKSGVILLEGGFSSGGSYKNWETKVASGTVVLIRDFPRAAALELVEECEPDDRLLYSIEPEQTVINKDALAAERERLMGRIAEIDSLLSNP